jgi:hypothetical protein
MTNPRNRTFSFVLYSDPGHGWLAVRRELLLRYAKAALSITRYSYQRGENVYLEEDCDCQSFLEALQDEGLAFKIVEKTCSRNQSRIRSYDRFSLTDIEKGKLA